MGLMRVKALLHVCYKHMGATAELICGHGSAVVSDRSDDGLQLGDSSIAPQVRGCGGAAVGLDEPGRWFQGQTSPGSCCKLCTRALTAAAAFELPGLARVITRLLL